MHLFFQAYLIYRIVTSLPGTVAVDGYCCGIIIKVPSFTLKCPDLDNKLYGHPTDN